MPNHNEMVNISRIKDGAMFATKDGTLYELINNMQTIEGWDTWGEENAEVKRIWRCKRLNDSRMVHFYTGHKVILLEGELRW